MGMGIGARGFVLEFVTTRGGVAKSHGTVPIPAKTATHLSSGGGAGLVLEWAEQTGAATEVLASVPMPLVAALKGT